LDVWPNPFRRFLDALTCRHLGLHDGHYLLDLVEASREPTRQAVRQQAERGVSRLVAQLHRPLARTAPTVAGLFSCLWVFLRTGTMPITGPNFTQPALPAKIPRNAVSISAPVSGKPTLAHSAMLPPVDHETR
jgi:hypothetical protein